MGEIEIEFQSPLYTRVETEVGAKAKPVKTTTKLDLDDVIPMDLYTHELIQKIKGNRVPERYIINTNATIIFWKDGDKTIVKRTKDDDFNARLGFLTAYFQKHSGMSRTQANKYLSNLKVED